MASVASGLRGQALLIHRVADLMYGDRVEIRVEIDPDFQAGSLVIPVHILYDGALAVRHFLSGENVTALANLMQLLGFFGIGGPTIYNLFKRLKGRKIEKPEDIPPDVRIDIPIELLVRIYNDAEVQTQLRKTLDPLHEEGVDEYQTRRQGVVIERVHKKDLQAADEAELEELTNDEEIELGIEKTAWRSNLAWHLNDGEKSFDAKIEDKSFWKEIAQGRSFAGGDRIRVHLRTVARRTASGALKIERTIPRVLGIEPVRRQPNLFEGRSNE